MQADKQLSLAMHAMAFPEYNVLFNAISTDP
jgi:hypothetical protein